MRKHAYYVVPDNLYGGWDVKREQQGEAHAHFPTRQEAVRFAEKVSLEEEADLYVYDEEEDLDWSVRRQARSSELNVWDESGALPPYVKKAIKSNPEILGISQGQIQPKDA